MGNSKKIRHVLGISGGKDSAALAIYLNKYYPEINVEYYFCDTGKELTETKQLIDRLEIYLGKPIKRLTATSNSHFDPSIIILNPWGIFYLPYNLDGVLKNSNSSHLKRNLSGTIMLFPM